MKRLGALTIGLMALPLASAAPGDQQDSVRHGLPAILAEVSGLAPASRDSVFAHNDEHAIVFEIAVQSGRIRRAFALGDPTIEGDFEGIATYDGRIYLITSDGLIYSAPPGKHRERVSFETFDTGVGPKCEIEGLSRSPHAGELLLLCKRFRDRETDDRLEIYRWKIGTDHALDEPLLSVPIARFLEKGERSRFGPSGLEWDPKKQRLMVVSARGNWLITMRPDGSQIRRQKLNAKGHPKTEGITLLGGNRLVLADEGSTTRQGRLAAYRWR